jgi:hypothetical protein
VSGNCAWTRLRLQRKHNNTHKQCFPHSLQPLCSILDRSRKVRYFSLTMLHRRSAIFSSRRVSTLFTPRLTDTTDEDVDAQTPTNSNRFSFLSFPTSRPPPEELAPISLEDALASAEPAEPPTDTYLIRENKYPWIRSLRTDDDIGDGLWICCHCHHENILRHWKGPYPFKYLRCDRCRHQLCDACHTSEILTPWPVGLISVPRPAPGQEVRYCHICANCGLSHRAEMAGTTLDFYGVTCAGCGISSFGDWPRYHIGNVEPYRRDPDSSYAKLVVVRADTAAKLSYQWETASLESDAVSRLSCRNPG